MSENQGTIYFIESQMVHLIQGFPNCEKVSGGPQSGPRHFFNFFLLHLYFKRIYFSSISIIIFHLISSYFIAKSDTVTVEIQVKFVEETNRSSGSRDIAFPKSIFSKIDIDISCSEKVKYEKLLFTSH